MMHRIRSIRKRGLGYTFANVFNRVVPEWLFRFRYYTVFRLKTDDAGFEDSDVECGWSTGEHELVAAEELTYFKREYSAGRVRATQAKIEGALVGAFWCAQELFDENELGVRVMLDKKQAWLFAALVDKSYRGRRIFPRLLRFTTEALAEQGVPDQLASVNPVNKASMAVFTQHSTGQPARVLAVRMFSIAICLTFGAATRDRTISFSCRKNPIRIHFPR